MDGAYKIMIFNSVKIVGKEIVIMDGSELESNIMNGMKESMMLTNLLQSLFTNEQVLRAYLIKNSQTILQFTSENMEYSFLQQLAKFMLELENDIEQDLRSEDHSRPMEVEGTGNGTVFVYNTFSECQALQQTFSFKRVQSEIDVFMDPNATNQFLTDAVKYVECVR